MRINADFRERVLLHADDIKWLQSPIPEVKRRPLDRIGDEVARATTIVSYEPNSTFPAHTHGGGEEFMVLDGVFEDEHGAYPAGSYLRNPPTSSHAPGSKQGCIIFVKLWQFDPTDRTFVKLRPDEMVSQPDDSRPGVLVTPLFKDQRETVVLEEWTADTEETLALTGGMEFLVLSGSLKADQDSLCKHSWLRVPEGQSVTVRAGKDGVRFYLKSGHLPYARPPAP